MIKNWLEIQRLLRLGEQRAKQLRQTVVDVSDDKRFNDGYSVGLKAYENMLVALVEEEAKD